ncbi:hypothetical protein [Sorangium sp. So ce1182]|uniref:hypothetical protein n=1 Tax=Sorangium sp. So ce1182 TaxID=3133334 RepID=UPI003F5E35FE
MEHDILIERLRARYRVPEGAGDPDVLRRRFDEIARTRLPAALDRALGRALAGLCLGPEAEIAIYRLAVRVRVQGDDVDDEALARAWARGIAEAVTDHLAPLAAQGGGVGDAAALFTDRFEAERAYLADRLAGIAGAWWHEQALGGRERRVPALREVIERWVRAWPERVPEALSALLLGAGFVAADVLSDAEAEALAELIEASRGDRSRALALELPPVALRPREGAVETAEERVAGAASGDGSAPGERRADQAEAPARALARLFAAPERLRGLLDAAEIEAVAAAPGSGWKRLLFTCFLLARRPSMPRLATLAAAPLEAPAEGQDVLQLAGPRPGESPRAGEALRPGESLRPEAHRTRDRAAVTPSGAAWDAALRAGAQAPALSVEHDVRCGGLLFLVRRVAASPLLDAFSGRALEERLVALGQLALGRALGLLPAGERRAAFERERPVLAVFSGVPALPDDLHVLPEGAAARDAADLLDALAALLPADLPPCREGVLATYGPDPEPFGPRHPHRALAHLLLRAGRLVVTRTRADLHMSVRSVDVALRREGWDIDPGFIPHLGRVIRFHYE